MTSGGVSPQEGRTHRLYENRLAECLRRGAFPLTVESPPLQGSKPLEEVVSDVVTLARWAVQDGRVTALTVSDRVRTDEDHDAILVGCRVAEATGAVPLVHWAGKGRTVLHLERDLERGREGGLSSFLLLTGDALRHPPVEGPARYLDSVDALRIARRQLPHALLAAAVNPFKYREEELWGQYLKAAKKVRAGADLLVTQIGWDPRKLAELARWLRHRGLGVPLLATVWLLTPRVAARFLDGASLPGVYVPPDLLECLRSEAAEPDGGRLRAIRRAALQVVGAMRLGLNGAHLCGVNTPRTLEQILDTTDEFCRAYPDLTSWWAAWEELLRHPSGRPVQVVPEGAYYLDSGGPGTSLTPGERRAYHLLQAVDRAVFDERSPLARALAASVRGVGTQSFVGRALARVESATKGMWLGCRMCGTCRLPHTFFVCPETCPKGLANGPCGGTNGNLCEFGDRECIHARIYRLAKYDRGLEEWERKWIPPVPEDARGACSWIRHYRREDPHAETLPEPRSSVREIAEAAT